jgi:dihydrofolate reductase
MAKLIYSTLASLDGYIEDSTGAFQWAAPDEQVFAFINDLDRPLGLYLYGRCRYDIMTYWETANTDPNQTKPERDYRQMWQAADKIVYSRTLSAPTTNRTRLERSFDHAAVRLLKQSSTSDLSIGGADLAGQAMTAGLVDECQLFLAPIAVGGGKPALPLNVRQRLHLLDERRFTSGTVYLRYEILPPAEASTT